MRYKQAITLEMALISRGTCQYAFAKRYTDKYMYPRMSCGINKCLQKKISMGRVPFHEHEEVRMGFLTHQKWQKSTKIEYIFTRRLNGARSPTVHQLANYSFTSDNFALSLLNNVFHS